jgi:putative transposase
MMNLSPSSYYYKPKVSREQRERQDANLRDQIEDVQSEFPQSGYRTVRIYLGRLGIRVGERRIRRVMKKFSLRARIKRAFKVTTDSNHPHRVYPNLLPELKVTGINQVWGADLTYIRIENGFVYLAVILDLYSRKIIGWAISKRIDGELAINALKMAISKRSPARGCIHHSDRGVQYLSGKYVELLGKYGFHISNSAKGNPYHNAFVESVIKTLKQQEVYLAHYNTYLDVVDNLPQFIEDVYNEKRVHSGIGYLTPNELELKLEMGLDNPSRFDLIL